MLEMNNKFINIFVVLISIVSILLFWYFTTDGYILSTSTTTSSTSTTTSSTSTSTSSTSTTTSTTTPPTLVGVSEDYESVQIEDESVIGINQYQGPYTLFDGYEGEYQEELVKEVSLLPTKLMDALKDNVMYINGCHKYAELLVGRCPYGVWDSSGTSSDGSKGTDWQMSIWISNRAFLSGNVSDVILHESAHALSFITRTCSTSDSSNYRKVSWEFFGGEEKFADSLVLYFGGEYNHYRETGDLTSDEITFIDTYLEICLSK